MRGAAIVGAGTVPPTKRPDPSVSVDRLLAQAVRLALDDAGLTLADVDGLGVSSFSLAPDRAIDLAWKLGLSLSWTIDELVGMTAFQHAVHAIEAGAADVIVLVGGDSLMGGDFRDMAENRNRVASDYLSLLPASGPNPIFALMTQAHMQHFGLTREDYGRVVIAQRRWAATHPHALYQSELSMEEYLNAPMVSYPLTIFDCPPLVSGAEAVVLAASDRDRAGAVSILSLGASYNHDNQMGRGWPTGLASIADDLWEGAGVGPHDMAFAQLYDDYPVVVLAQLEDLGYIEGGDASRILDPESETFLPVNTSGGLLTYGQAGYGGGLHGLVEAVRQLRGQREASGIDAPEFGVVAGYGMLVYRYGANSVGAVLRRPAHQ